MAAILAPHPDAAKVAEKVLAGSGVTPPEYLLAALSDILDIRPHDTLFKIIPQPGQGCGKVICLEEACLAKKKIIILNEQADLPDGGKALGIGSLDYFIHHQKESPAHQRAIKARLKANRGVIPRRADVKPTSSTILSAASTTSSASNNNKNKEKKRTLIELSDGDDDDDDILIVPNKKKASLPTPTTEKSTYSTEALPIINQTSIPGNTSTFQTDSSSKAAVAAAPPLPRVDNGNADALLPSQPESDKAAAPINQLDKGKGRAVEQDHTLLPTSVNTNKEVTSQVNFGSNTAIPLILQSASKRPRDKYDHPSSDDSEITKRSDRSFVDDSDDDDDDLVDLSSIYGSKSKKLKSDEDASSKANSSITSLKGEKESIVGEPTALKPFSAPSKNAQRPVAYTSAAYDEFKALQRNGDSLSGAKPNTAAKNGKMGEDQFQLNSTLSMRDVRPPVPSSSSSPAIDKGKNAGMDSGYLSSLNTSSSSPLPGIKSALPTSLDKKPSISAGTPSATTSTSKYPLSADRIRKLQATERSITSARYRMGTLQREMRKYGKRTTKYQVLNSEYKRLEASLPKLLALVKTIKDEANAPKKPATPVVPTPTASTSAVGALASSSKAAPAATLVQSAVTAADKAYHVALALFERRDTIKQLIDRVPDKRQKKYYQPNLDSTIQQLADAQKQLRAHLADAPKPPKKEAKPPTPTPSALKYQHSNMMQSSTAQYAHMLSGKSRATTYPSQSVDGSAGINAYGDSEDSMGFLAGRGAFLLQSGATYVTAGPSNLSAVTSGYRHTANLGPTGLAPASDLYKPLGSHNYWPSEDAEVPAWRRGLEDYSGGERIYTEAETLSFFKDAAAGYDFNDEGEKAIDEALVTIGLEQQGDSFPGTTIQPFAHQILGIAWMLDQEKVRTKIMGGILADDMGLGKTVQTISLIHLHQAKEGDDEKATLVLAPTALLEQWKSEVTKHTGGSMKAYIYHDRGRRITKDELQKYDIVLTTPQTMALEWEMCDDTALRSAKNAAAREGVTWTEADEAEWHRRTAEQTKPLFMINWRRMVIDEAQYIRNHRTRVSRACCYLNATYRWCLTGTPITNTLTDIYSLIRFLRIHPWQDWNKWRDEIFKIEKKQPARASQKVQAILKLVLLRRNKDSELNGKRLLNLKPMIMEDTPITLSEDEQNVYDYIEGKSQQQLSKYIREGTVMKNYAHVLVLLLRLRQCVGHPALVTESCLSSAYTKVEDAAADKAEAHQLIVKGYGQATLDAMLRRRLDLAKQRFEDEKAQKDVQMEECPICMDPLDASALITPCGHTFCGCIKQWIDLPETAAQNPENFGEEDRACPNCRQKITKKTLFTLQHFEPTKEQLAEITGTEISNDEAEFEKDLAEFLRKKNLEAIKKKSKRESSPRKPRAAKSRAAKRRIVKDSEDEDDFIDDSEETNPVAGYTKKTGAESDSEAEIVAAESDSEEDFEAEETDDGDIKDFLRSKREGKQIQVKELTNDVKEKFRHVEGREFIPSAKMEAMLRIIREAPKDDKFMIVSQWTSMLDLVAAYLHEQRVPYLRFQGDMSRKDRDAAVQRFNEGKKVKCMLLSLKAGGVGLNMVGGNRAILLDLAWSPAVEGQAFGRLHRLGQTKTVFVNRCIVAGSVEDRIMSLQEHKKKLADHSLGEGTGEKLKKFGIAELKMLFGMGAERGHFADTWVHPDHDKSAPKATRALAAGPSNAIVPPPAPTTTV